MQDEQDDGATIAEGAVEIPHTELTPAALLGLVEDFATRDGTDYGHAEVTLDQKVTALMRQLKSGEAKIFYESEGETISIVVARDH